MGGVSKVFKQAFDPAHLVTNKDQPVTLKSFAQGIHSAFDPVSSWAGDKIAAHNNTQDNLHGYMDPGQIFGANATTAPPYMPMIHGNPGTGYNPSMPANGVSTNGLQGGMATNGLSSSPDWASIIANALRK